MSLDPQHERWLRRQQEQAYQDRKRRMMENMMAQQFSTLANDGYANVLTDSDIRKAIQILGGQTGLQDWRCDACGNRRLDPDIEVMSYTLKSSGVRNFKFCKDSPMCKQRATDKARTGEM